MHFLTYNNAIPIVLGVLFLSSGLVFAANEEARKFVADSVYQAEQTVVSIDNSYIANKDLGAYSPKVSIDNVTEDSDSYFITFTFTTIALSDGVWQDIAQSRTMQVAKTALGEYTDLGVYVTEQLKQLVDREIAYLREVQKIERKQVTSKVVATAYSGLIGKFVDESTETLPGYVPLVAKQVAEEVDPVAIARAEKSDVVTAPPSNNSNNSNNSGNSSGSQADQGPVITILGANPARIPRNSSYSDLGAVTTSQEGVTLDLSITLSLNGEETSRVEIDTSTVADWSVGYSVTDQDGNTSFVERVVIVYDPNAPEEEETETTATSTATTTEETTATSTEEITTETQEETTTETTQATSTAATSTEETTTQEQPAETATSTEEVPTETQDETTATSTEPQ